MAEGFYVTDIGVKKIAQAVNKGTKVNITNVSVGSGGDIEGARNYGITALNNQIYTKQLDEYDHYEILEDAPNTIRIEFIIPDSAGEMSSINEVGFLDDQNNLILYGVIQDIAKHVGTSGNLYRVVIAGYIPFVNDDLTGVNLVIGTDAVRELERQVATLNENVQTNTADIKTLETASDTHVVKRVGYDLSSNDFTSTYRDQITDNQNKITSIIRDMAGKASTDQQTNLEQRVKTNENSIKTINTELGKKASQTHLDGVSSTLSALDKEVGTLRTTVQRKAEEQSYINLSARVSNIESTLSGLQTTLSDLATQLESLK